MSIKAKTGIAIAIVCAVLVAVAGFTVTLHYAKKIAAAGNAVQITNGTSPTNVINVSESTDKKLTVAEVAKKVGPAIVSIDTETEQRDFFGRSVSSTGSGSGIIFAENGYIVTNNHVTEGASSVSVTLADGNKYQAQLVGADSTTDLAVLKIDAKGLPYAVLGDSKKLNAGDTAVALGNPLGRLSGTVTTGIISATDREITTSNDGNTMNLIQTDATVNPGNSGGALCNEYGEVVGIVNSKIAATGVEGLGFAIPINDAKPIIEKLTEQGATQKEQTPSTTEERGSMSEALERLFPGLGKAA